MLRRFSALLLVTCLVVHPVFSDSVSFRTDPGDRDGVRLHYTAASIRASLLYRVESFPTGMQNTGSVPGMRSIPLAFGLSAVVPGLGQAYNGQWGKAAVAIALEAAAVTGYVLLRRNGLDEEEAFQMFAHEYWDPDKYARWLNDYTVYLTEELGASISAPPVSLIGVDFQSPDTWTGSDRQQIAAFFSQIRVIERDVFHPETGAVFSHQLPGFGEQQYYELIGKYFQFAPGWSDYADWRDDNGSFTDAIDPEMTGTDGSKPNVSDRFLAYAKDHAHSQDVLRQASRVSLLFVVNHVIASIDAAVSAKLHNNRISTRMGLAWSPFGDPVPVASLSIRL